jgi:hypothetical protein
VFDKVPSSFWEPLWVWGIGALGAVAGFLEDFHIDDGWRTWLLKLLTKGTSAALAAKLTYHALLALGLTNGDLHILLVGISGHMGTEALRHLAEVYKSRVK